MHATRPTLQITPAWQGQQHYLAVRTYSLALAAPLSAEDQCVQSMPDASPTKWHLAHTTWFFETMILRPHASGYQVFDPSFHYLFNSYYEALGPRHPRPQRGLLTRPALDEVLAYRRHVDDAMQQLLESADATVWSSIAPLLSLGLQHEQQHQELILTDILHALWCNPLLPAYQPEPEPLVRLVAQPKPLRWLAFEGGLAEIGGLLPDDGFVFDNETPRHTALLHPYALADRLVSCGDFESFIADGGYHRAELWLSEGWARVQQENWQAPAYWLSSGDPRLETRTRHTGWHVFGLQGVKPLQPEEPVSQLSFYEACAYAEWAGARLPTEFEWEAACGAAGLTGMCDQVWQWTRSSYDPYPGFKPQPGVASEYNGKFMVGQLVLRGGSVATPPGHTRPSYRNFFPPATRWQFSGLRLAKDL